MLWDWPNLARRIVRSSFDYCDCLIAISVRYKRRDNDGSESQVPWDE